jgi:hypothetical protein
MRVFLEIDGTDDIPTATTLVHILFCFPMREIVHRGDESMKIMANVGEFVKQKGIYPAWPVPIKFSSSRWKGRSGTVHERSA